MHYSPVDTKGIWGLPAAAPLLPLQRCGSLSRAVHAPLVGEAMHTGRLLPSFFLVWKRELFSSSFSFYWDFGNSFSHSWATDLVFTRSVTMSADYSAGAREGRLRTECREVVIDTWLLPQD